MTYLFHQTPKELCKELMKYIEIGDDDVVFEPFAGECAFYDAFPNECSKVWCEINPDSEISKRNNGLTKDYREITEGIDWVITNPPFRINGKNEFWNLIIHFTNIAKKGVAFLCNDKCFSSMTPKRLLELKMSIHKIVVCNVKKWRGRYFFIVFKPEPCDFYQSILGSF